MSSPAAFRRAVFVDTSGWYALLVERDANHVAARRQFQHLAETKRVLVLTNYVASETYTLLRMRRGARAALGFLRHMLASVTINRVRVEEAWERSAEDLLDQYQDHELSYTDATSFVTMRALRIPQAMSFDLDFELAGFQTLT